MKIRITRHQQVNITLYLLLKDSTEQSHLAMDRSSSRNASSTHRLAQKFNSADMETIDDRLKTLKKAESNECLSGLPMRRFYFV